MGSKRRWPGLNPWTRKYRAPITSAVGSSHSQLALWRDGVVLPLVPVVLGLFPLFSGHFECSTRGARLILDGGPARALGFATIVFGTCLHVHFFWEPHETLSDYSQPAMIAAISLFLSALAYIASATLA